MSNLQPKKLTMVTNFDSTEQRRKWNELLQDEQDGVWFTNFCSGAIAKHMNVKPSLVSYFSGIIRTAYLYSSTIVLTDAQLLDGIFFLALGPTAVNEILAKDSTDNARIVVSGRESSLEECLLAFTCKKTGSSVGKATDSMVQQTTQVENDDSNKVCYALRALEYCSLEQKIICKRRFLDNSKSCNALTEEITYCKQNQLPLAPVIARALSESVDQEGQDCTGYTMLAECWQDWIDAEKLGLIVYENQNDEGTQTHVPHSNFPEIFKRTAGHYSELVTNEYYISEITTELKKPLRGLFKSEEVSKPVISGIRPDSFNSLLQQIAGCERRSDAFAIINKHRQQASTERECSQGNVYQFLRDWYQFVYMRSLAEHLGTYLIVVDASNNSFEDYINDKGDKSSLLVLAGTITEALGSMTNMAFSLFCYQARKTLGEWRECVPTDSRLKQRRLTRDVAYKVECASNEKTFKTDAYSMFGGLVLALVLGLVSVLSDKVWLSGSAPLWIIILAAWFVSVIPDLLDTLKWIRGVRLTTKTILYNA